MILKHLIWAFLLFYFVIPRVKCGKAKCQHDFDWDEFPDEGAWMEDFEKKVEKEFISPYAAQTDELEDSEEMVYLSTDALRIKPPVRAQDDYPPWVTVPVESLHNQFFKRVFKLLITKGLFFNCRHTRKETPYMFKNPVALRYLFNFTLDRSPASQDLLLKFLEQVIQFSPHNSHPFVVTRRTAGLDPYGLVADWITAVTSGITGSFILAPGYNLMEIEVGHKLRELIGYPHPREEGSSVFTPGAGAAVHFALQIALQMKFPGIKEKGIFGLGGKNRTAGSLNVKPCLFISDVAGYAAQKGALFQGIGADALKTVKTDDYGRMITSELKLEIEKAKTEGWTPFMVIGTAGSPRLGAIDPINDLADICKENNLWYHVDANFAGGLIMSKNHRYKLQGVEKSDSFGWSPTQLLDTPFTTTVLVLQKIQLTKTLGLKFGMPVFGVPPFYNNTFDLGDSTLQTARKADVFKLWFIWKANGKKGLAAKINYDFANVKFAMDEIHKRPMMKLLQDSFDFTLVSFIVIHPLHAGMDMKDETFLKRNDKFTNALKARLLIDGVMLISVNSLKQLPKFFTMYFSNNVLTMDDVIYMLDQIENFAKAAAFKDDGSVIFYADGAYMKSLVRIPPTPDSFPFFASASIPQLHMQFFIQIFKVILGKGLYSENRRKWPMFYRSPESIIKEFIPDYDLTSEPEIPEKLIKIVRNVIKYNSFQAHPYYMYQLVSGRDAYSVIGDFFISTLTSPMITYEDNPVFITVEDELIKEICKLIGYPIGHGDGIATSGGSFAVQISIALARYMRFPETKMKGNNIVGKQLVMYTSRRTKRAYMKGAFYAGFGTTKLVSVDTHRNGRMKIDDLKKVIKKSKDAGDVPLLVAASVGTSIYGAIDPLDEIADICKENKIWLHVDGSFGGAVIFSDREKHRLKGIEKADSFHINAHKLLGAVSVSTLFVTRHSHCLIKSFGLSSTVDFALDSELYDKGKYDQGDKNVETSRRADLFKFWFMWKAKGTDGFAAHIDYIYDIAKFLQETLEAHPRFEPILKEWDVTNVCFYYIPDKYKELYEKEKETDPEKLPKEFVEKITKVTNELQSILAHEGVTYCQVSQNCNNCTAFFRWAITHSGFTKEDVVYLVNQVDNFGMSNLDKF